MNKKKNIIFDRLSKILPDDRPVTSLQIIENIDKCPEGFYPINKSYDQDQDADLWREGNTFLKKKSVRYLCLSKSEGLPDFVVQELIVLSEKSAPPEGYSILNRTADSEQKAWRKKQICYRLVNRRATQQAVTDIIVCSRLKLAPEGFKVAGEVNGVLICFKMGNVQEAQSTDQTNGNGGNYANSKPPERPPKPPGKNNAPAYPSLSDGDGDYEILNPNYVPTRPAPRPPSVVHQNSTHNTLSSGHSGLEGVPFIINPKFINLNKSEKLQIPMIKARTMQQLLKDYNYDFRLERST